MDVITEILNYSINDAILHNICTKHPLDYYIPLINHTFSLKWVFIGDKTYRNGKYHSFNDLPATISSTGSQLWYKHGKHHRDDDKPAVIYYNGVKVYYKYGKNISLTIDFYKLFIQWMLL